MLNQESHFYEFGPFRLDPVKRRLLRNGESVPLTPKAFDTLLTLVQHWGKTLEKDELMRLVWPDAVVEENNLSQNISALRKALGDSRDESRYIATIPGLGYRFVADVRTAPFADPEPPVSERRGLSLVGEPARTVEGGSTEPIGINSSSAETANALAPDARPELDSARDLSGPAIGEGVIATLRRHRGVAALVLALIVIAAAAAGSWIYDRIKDQPEVAANRIEVSPLTRTGTTGIAAISPDGKQIVYTVREGWRESLWLRQTAASGAQQILTSAPVEYNGLTFSGDGNYLYLVRTEMNRLERSLYRLPVLGGVSVKLASEVYSPVTLSPDGKRLAFIRNSAGKSTLVLADVDGGSQQVLAARPMTDNFKIPDWSPDGKVIACSAGSGDPYDVHNSIVIVRVEDGNQLPASPQRWAWTRWVEWVADGSGLLITAREKHASPDQVWYVAYPGGAAQRITGDSRMYFSISLTGDSQTIAAIQTQLDSDIWVAPNADAAQARKITFGTGSYLEVCFAPDGRIAYTSQASGDLDIWIMNPDGSGRKQLTADAGVNAHQAVSPDGRFIAFASNRSGVFNIWRMDADGGNPVRLTTGGGEKSPQFSPDGKWIVYSSVSLDESLHSIWKVAVEGGEPIQLTARDSGPPAVSPDGEKIAFMQGDGSAGNEYRMVVMSFAGGPPERTLSIPRDITPLPAVRWYPDGKGLTYSAHHEGVSNIWMQLLGGGAPKQLTQFKVEGRFLFDWSRDGKHLVLTRRAWPSDLVLLRGFLPVKS